MSFKKQLARAGALTGIVLAFVVPANADFLEVSTELGIDVEHQLASICNPPLTAASAWSDFDADGDVDVYFTNHGGTNWLFENRGDGNGDGLPEFVDVAAEVGAADDGVGLGTVFVDYDNDGDQDLLVLRWGGNLMLQNQLAESGEATFVDVTTTTGLADGGRAITAAWADYDGDGYLDVYLTKHGECDTFSNNFDSLYRNLGNGSFENVTEQLCDGTSPGCDPIQFGLGFAPGWFDYDDDGDLDLYVVNDNIQQTHHHNVLWRNDGPGETGWRFTDVSEPSGTDISLNGMGLGIGDINNDGWLDIAFSNIGKNYLMQNRGNGTFLDVTGVTGTGRAQTPLGDESITWGTVFFDYDNDKLLDLFIVAGYIGDPPFTQPNAFFKNNGAPPFSDLSAEAGLDDDGRGRGASVADFDADGYPDLVVNNYGGTARIYQNRGSSETGKSNHWLALTVEGSRSNRDAIGTRLWVATPDGTTQVREISSGPTHGGGDQRVALFGLADNTQGEVTVRWPDGQAEELGAQAADRYLHLVQPLFVVDPPEPGVAGTTNTFQVTGAAAFDELALVRGAGPGSTRVPGCDSAQVLLSAPAARDREMSDGTGAAVLTDEVPPQAAGATIWYQVVNREKCAVSNRIRVEY